MTIGQYFLLAAIVYPVTGYLCYLFIYKPAKRKIYSQYSVKPEAPETESVTYSLNQVEGRQVLVIPTECELSVSKVKIKRVADGMIIYPTDQTWEEYAEIFTAVCANSAKTSKNKKLEG